MNTLGRKHQTGCPVAHGIDAFGDRWSLLIIRDMLLHGSKTYGDFLAAGEGIATNILADRLKRFEAEGIVERSRDPANGRSNIYTLTDKGIALAPVIFEIIRWSGQYMPLTRPRRQLLERIKNDPAGLMAEIRARQKARQ